MCDLCMRAVCPSGCPNADVEETYVVCSHCGDRIHVGEEAWSCDSGEIYCSEECLDDAIEKHTLVITEAMLEW